MLNRPNLDYIINERLFINQNLKKIIHVYQKQYGNYIAQGLGDFLRGSIYLIYICILLNLEFDIDFTNHSLSNFLNMNNKIYNMDYSKVEALINFNEFTYENEYKFIVEILINKLNNCKDEQFYLFNNSVPLFDIGNTDFNIIQKAREIIIPKIEPKQYILDILDSRLKMKGLEKNKYSVIHIRCGDYFMNIKKKIDSEKHKISLKHINDIINTLKRKLDPVKKYIIIGDSNKIKKYVASKFSNIVMFDSGITHLGEDTTNNENSILDTLIDFNIIRFSNFTVSFTAYGHGSGFSKYASLLYNIPFKQIILQPVLQYNV